MGERRGVVRVVRWTATVVAVVLAVVMILVATAANFVRDRLFDTDDFVATSGQLARDEVVRTEVERVVSAELDKRLDTGELVDKAGGWLADQGAPAEIEPLLSAAAQAAKAAIEDEVREFVGSEEFVRVWEAAVRRTHTAAMSVIRGTGGDSVVANSGKVVTVDLGEVVAQVKQRLQDEDFELADRIPKVDAKLVILDDDVVPQAQEYARLVDGAAAWAPWIAVALLAVAAAVAPGRRRAALLAGLVLAVSAGAVTLALVIVTDRVGAESADTPAVPVVLEAFIGQLRGGYLTWTVIGAVLAAVSWLCGPSRPARRLRKPLRRKSKLEAASR